MDNDTVQQPFARGVPPPPPPKQAEPPTVPPVEAGYPVRQRWVDLGLVMVISILPSIISATHELLHPGGTPGGRSNYSFAMGILHMASCLLLLLYVLARQKRTLKKIGLGFHWTDFFVALGLTFAAISLVTILGIIVYLASSHFLGRPTDIRNRDLGMGILPALFLAYGVVSSIFEEVLVRGYLMTELVELGKPMWLAVIASIVLQTSYHVYYGLGGAVSISGIFIVFALYFALGRRLLPVILAHMYWDVGAFFMKHH